MKKILALVMSLMLACCVLAGCKGGSAGESPEGYWVLSSADVSGIKMEASQFSEEELPFFSFEKDGTFVSFFESVSKGNWEKTDKGVKVIDQDVPDEPLELMIQNGKLVLDVPELGIKMEYTRSKERPKAMENLGAMEETTAE